jgi:hypothetical protein
MEQANVALDFFLEQFCFLPCYAVSKFVVKKNEKNRMSFVYSFISYEEQNTTVLDLFSVNQSVYGFRINQSAEPRERGMFIASQIEISKKHEFDVQMNKLLDFSVHISFGKNSGQMNNFSCYSLRHLRVFMLPTGKKIKKYRRNARCMKTRFQPVFFVNDSQTIYSVFINRYQPRYLFNAVSGGFPKPNKRSDFRGFQ